MNVDDAPADGLLLPHHFGAFLAHHEDAGKVGVNHLLPLSHFHAHHERITCDTRVVHDHVHLAKSIHRFLEETLDISLVSNVGLNADSVTSRRLDLVRDLLSGASGSCIVNDDASTSLTESESDGSADAAGRTSDDAHGAWGRVRSGALCYVDLTYRMGKVDG